MELSRSVRQSWDQILRNHEVQGLRNEEGTLLWVPEEYGRLHILRKADTVEKQGDAAHGMKVRPELPEMIIAGYASPQVVDKEKHLITKEAMAADLPRFLAHPHYRNVMVVHTNIQVGEVLPEWTHPETGEVYKTQVDDIGLFAVVKIRTDPFRPAIVDQVIKDIESGELAAFSISGDAPYESRRYQCSDGTCFWTINEIEHYEITICQKGVNQDAKYAILAKAAFCQGGDCPIRLPTERITLRTVRTAVAKAEKNHQDAQYTGAAGDVAKHPGHDDQSIHGSGEPAEALPDGVELYAHSEEDRAELQSVWDGLQDIRDTREVTKQMKRLAVAGEISWGAAEFLGNARKEQIKGETPQSRSRTEAMRQYLVDKPGHRTSKDASTATPPKPPMAVGATPGDAEGSWRTGNMQGGNAGADVGERAGGTAKAEDDGDDEHQRAVSFLWQHGRAYVAGSHPTRRGSLRLRDGEVTVRLTSGRSESVGRYSADQVNEAMGRALKFVQTGGREHGPMELHDTPRSPHSEHDPRAGRDMVSQTVRPPSAAENQEAWAGYEDLNGSRPEMLYHWTTRENAAQILSGEGDHAIFLPGEEGNSSAEVFFSPGQEDEMTEERLPDDAVQIAVAPDYSDMRWMPGDRGARGNDVVYRGNLATDRVKIVQNSAHEQGPKLEEHDTSNSPHREHGPGAGSRTGNDADIETAYDERAEAVGNYTQLMILVEQKGKEHLRPKMEAALQRYGQALERVRELDPEGGKAAGPGRPLEVGWTGGGSTEEKAPSSPGIGGFHPGDQGAQQTRTQPGPKTTSGSGIVSDPVYTELSAEEKAQVAPGIITAPHSQSPGTLTQEETCAHGCFATVEDVKELQEQPQQPSQPAQQPKVSKAEGNLDMTARPYGGPHDEDAPPGLEPAEHEPYGSIQRRRDQPGETESEEHYLNKAVDTATVVLCVALNKEGHPVAGIRQDRKHGEAFEFPGGHVRVGETMGKAAERELLEESGVEARAVRKLGEKRSPNDGVPVIFVQLEPTGGEPRDSNELTDVRHYDPAAVRWAFDDSREMVDIALGGALSKHDKDPGHLHAPDFKKVKKGTQTFGEDVPYGEQEETEEKSAMTVTHEPLVHTDEINMRKHTTEKPHPHGRGFGGSTGPGKGGSMEKPLGAGKFPWQRNVGKNCALCETEQVLEQALDVREWRSTASSDLRLMSRFALDSLREGDVLSHTEGRWFALAATENGMLRQGLAVELNSLLSMIGKHALDIGATDLWGQAFRARAQVDKLIPVSGQIVHARLEALSARLIKEGQVGVAAELAGSLLDLQVRKGYGVGWYSNAQRTLAHAAGALRRAVGDLPTDEGGYSTALTAILSDIDQLEAQLGVTREMEKGTIHEEVTQSELDIVREVAKDTEENVAEADGMLEAVGARDPEPTMSAEPANALNDPAQQTMPENVAVRTGAPSYVARSGEVEKFVDLRDDSGAVLATLEDGKLDIDEDEVRRVLEGHASGLHTVED